MAHFEHLARALGLGALVVLLGGYLLARLLRRHHLRASWAALCLPLSYLALGLGSLGLRVCGTLLLGCTLSASWQRQDLDRGADYADAARARLRIRDAARRALWRAHIRRRGWLIDGRLVRCSGPRGARMPGCGRCQSAPGRARRSPRRSGRSSRRSPDPLRSAHRDVVGRGVLTPLPISS
jgi:hypothetical protein